MLDDQAMAKKYEGQGMVVTGTLNATHNTIYVRKIEAVCELPVYRLERSRWRGGRFRDSIPPGTPTPDPTIPPPPQPELPPEEPPYPDAPTPNPGIPPLPPPDPNEPEPQPT
jgi:hypothetical protein